MKDIFRRAAVTMAQLMGSPWVFLAAVFSVLVWAATGPLFGFSDTWQLVINTGTTVVTFLLVFLIQNTQNRDAKAIHLKLDELLRGVEGARTGLVDLQSLTDDQLEELQAQFQRLRHREDVDVGKDLVREAKKAERLRGANSGTPDRERRQFDDLGGAMARTACAPRRPDE
jgi:low affinity Fe/Cu permease